MKPFEPIVMRSTAEQRGRFFASSLWKDIEDVLESIRLRELEVMAAPGDFGEADLHVERSRGRIEVLRGMAITLKQTMCVDEEES